MSPGGTREDTTAPTVVDRVHAQPTETMAPTKRDAAVEVSTTSFVTSPDRALLLAEVDRTRAFCMFLLPLVLVAAAMTFLIGGDPLAREWNLGGMALIACACAWILAVTRDPSRYRTWHNVVFGQVCAAGLLTAIYYWGPFSGVLLVVPFGAYIFAMVESMPAAVWITVLVMVTHAALSVSIIMGLVADRGVIAMPAVSRGASFVILALIDTVILATFAVARELRRSSKRSVEELDAFARAVARRDALLAEARHDLREMRHAGGPGPYTGQTIGSFALGNILGRGAMGDVYEAVRASDDLACAVKMLSPQVLHDSSHYKRFVREAQIAASVDVANVVKVLEIGTGEGELPYLAMEKLVGDDLSSYLKQNPRMPLDEVVDLVRQVGRGLAAAHAKGVVHRDLKPHNLFRAETGGEVVWKILDFGVSKLTGSEGTLTQGRVIGTPGYMAPEQARGEEVDYRADLYALGVIAYRAITGVPAFPAGDDVPKTLYKVVYTMPPAPSTIADVPASLDSILARAMAKQPSLRYQDADAFADALEAAR